MSVPVRPDQAAFEELELLVRNLVEELATFRRRALTAEARVKELEGGDASARISADAKHRLTELEKENAALQERLDATADRTGKMLEKVRFLRQQTEGNGGGDR